MTSRWEVGLLSTIILVRQQSGRIKDLKGFRKGHQIPAEVSDHTQAFIGRIAEQDLRQDLDERFDEFRRLLKFRRVEISVTDPLSGTGLISTPWFDYQVSVLHDPNDAAAVLWRRQLSEFRQIDKLDSDEVKSVFGTTFDTVELMPPASIDVPAMIDQIEEEADARISLDYDRQTTWCAVTIQGIAGQMQFTSDRISLFIHQAQPPAKLLDAFFKIKLRISEIQRQ
ncbi:MAG TPA: hypothetical protein PLY87_15325 [Planctomycetaceae bacterium]|nr:hypothetical protein [Planctomycetaceae bacterium]HQZ66460.1 hypothetical protein [Planctomycetaceae bacterium]